MAELIKSKLGIETELIEGGRGEFTVLVGDQEVAQKGWFLFPSETKILESVEQALASD